MDFVHIYIINYSNGVGVYNKNNFVIFINAQRYFNFYYKHSNGFDVSLIIYHKLF